MTLYHNEARRTTPLEIFCSYAHEDNAYRQELERHLSVLSWQNKATLWHDRRIAAGTNWSEAIDAHLETAAIILLLVSSDFLASQYCYGIEMQRALQRHEDGLARVIPIIVRSCDWQSAPFAQLQALPTDGQPITTWSDRDTAWTEVVKGVRRVLEEVSLSGVGAAAKVAGPAIWNVPFARNPFFTGRDELLERLHTQLFMMQTAAVSQPQAVSGLGGVGKTQLVTEYAYQYASEYQTVLWARADTAEALNASYTEIAQVLNLPQKDAQEQEVVVQAVKGWLRSKPGWLLILDNADEPAVLTSFLPKKIGGQVLVTTRASTDLVGLGLGFGHAIALETFTDEVGALFLLHRSDLLAPDATLEQAEKEMQRRARAITQELGGLPLVLDQAGAYLKNTKCGLAVYQQIYQQHRAQLLKERRSADHPESVATTWLISFEKVEQQNPAAADLLRLCAYLSPDVIPEEILTEGAGELGERLSPVAADPFLLNQAIESLRAYSLIERDPLDRTLTVHRLVQAVVRDRMFTKTQEQWMQRTIHAVSATFPALEFEEWSTCERLLSHVLVCATWIEQLPNASPKAALLFHRAGGYFSYYHGGYKEAEALSRLALSIDEQQLGAQHPDTASSLNSLAELYRVQGKYKAAEPLLNRALAILEHSLGPEHPDTQRVRDNYAALLKAMSGQ